MLAPKPPISHREAITVVSLSDDNNAGAFQASQIEPASGVEPPSFTYNDPVEYQRTQRKSFKTANNASGCATRNSFDSKALLAYQWGDNRLGLDLGGIDTDGATLKYRMRLQPQKIKKHPCNKTASWQSVIGEGYNKIFD